MTELIPLLLVVPALVVAAGAAGSEGSDDGSQYPGQPGAVTATSGGFVGVHTAGTLPEDGAILADFSVHGVPVFAALNLTDWQLDQKEVDDSTVEVQGHPGKLKLDDAPAAYMIVEFESGQTLTVVPAPGASIVLGPSDSAKVTNGAFSGLIWSDCGDTSLALSQGSAVLGPASSNCRLWFRADTQQHPISSTELEGALASGQLAAEVTVEGDGTYALTHVESFEPVEVQVHASDGYLVVAVSGNTTGARSVVILVPDQVLPAETPVEGSMDGQPLAQADANAALVPGNSTTASFARVSSNGVAAIVLSIPSFSVHIFELRAAGLVLPPLAGGQPIPLGEAAVPLALGAVAAVGAGAALLRRPHDE